MTRLTQAQKSALRWLLDHNGDGGFDTHNVLIAAGVKAPFMRSTWNALAVNELVEFYGGRTGKRRVKLTQAGSAVATSVESMHDYRDEG